MGRASSARINGGRNARYTRPFFCTSVSVFLLGEAYCSCRRYTDVLISTLEEQKEGAHIVAPSPSWKSKFEQMFKQRGQPVN